MGKNIKPFLAVPTYGPIDVHFFAALQDFTKAAKSYDYELKFLYGDSLVARARNSLTMEFLASDCSHLLFIDSDLVFSLDQIKRILSHNEHVVGGFYPKKQQGPVEFVFNCNEPPSPMDERRLTPVKYMGTGFLCVSRHVIETMIEKLGDDIIFKVDQKDIKFAFDFWPVGVYKFKDGTRRYLSEDWYFCQRAIDLGFTVYGDNAICLKHSGGAVYPLATQEEGLFMNSNGIDKRLEQDVEHYDIDLNFDPETILDIGANVGAFSRRCLKKWPNSKITAYEPIAQNFDKLKSNCPNIKSINGAVREFSGMDSIYSGKTETTYGFHDIGDQNPEKIFVKCFDAASIPSHNFVKVDTEGCEIEILNNLNLDLTSAVVCEYHRASDKEEICKLMQDRGFKQIGWTYYADSLGLLKFAKNGLIKYAFNGKSYPESIGNASATVSPLSAGA